MGGPGDSTLGAEVCARAPRGISGVCTRALSVLSSSKHRLPHNRETQSSAASSVLGVWAPEAVPLDVTTAHTRSATTLLRIEARLPRRSTASPVAPRPTLPLYLPGQLGICPRLSHLSLSPGLFSQIFITGSSSPFRFWIECYSEEAPKLTYPNRMSFPTPVHQSLISPGALITNLLDDLLPPIKCEL